MKTYVLYKEEAEAIQIIIEKLSRAYYKIRNELTKQDEQEKVRDFLEEERTKFIKILNERGWNYHNGTLSKIAQDN